MDRRSFLLTSLAGALAAPMGVRAQPAAVRRIGFIANAPRTMVTDSFLDAFVAGLQEHGWVESRNVVLERRYGYPSCMG
jgi:hypothetical protein